MTILIISSHFHEMFGGVADYTFHLSKALAREKVAVFVLTSNDEKVKKDKDNEVQVLPLIDKWNVFSLPEVMRTIRKIQPDVVNIQYVPYMYNYYGVPLHIAFLAVLTRTMRFPLITSFHEIAIRFSWRKPKYWGIAILQRIIAYILALCSNKVIVNIEFYQEMLKPFQQKLYTIPVGSNVIPIPMSYEERTTLRNKIAPYGEVIIATFGSGAPWRRTDLMLRAGHQFMKDSGQSVKVLILGSQGDPAHQGYRDLKQLISKLGMQKFVSLTGYLEDGDAFKYLSVAELFVLLDTDPYGGVSAKSTSLVAAYAAGLAIVGNKGLLTDSFLKHAENIYFVGSLEIGEIARAIALLVNDRAFRQLLAEGSIHTFRERLTWEKIAKRHLGIMRCP